MKNRAETMSLGNRTFSDPTAFDAIRRADMGDQIVRPKTFHANQDMADISIPKLTSSKEPITLFSAKNTGSNNRENSQPNRGSSLNEMTIDQLNELAAQMRCQIKFHGAIPDENYSTLMRYIDYHKQQLKKKAKQ